ncbi:putative periplasmic protein [Campylobacter jejuni subsp. jejuni 414]|nr:putative periplasmic protein [Campylobacter jejuni subsp. jejuni 414]
MENNNRCIFSLSGVTGMLIATVLLLVILVILTIWGLKAQQEVMQKPYNLKDIQSVKMFGSKEQDHRSIKEAQ